MTPALPEEAVKAAINAWFEETRPHVMNTTPLPEQARRMRLAITAALPFLQRVEALDGAAKIADELEERTKLKYMSPDGEECQIVPLTVIIEAAKALRALPFLIKRERDLAERQLTDVVDRMSDDYLALKSQVVELSKDAARYRYLRNGSISDLPYDDHGCGPEFPTGHDLDAAVDAKIISADPNLQSGEPE